MENALVYKEIEFESLAYRERGAADKTLFSFDQSLAGLQKAGYKRHPRPAEAFGLLADSLEGKLIGTSLQAVADDMLTIYGEWLSAAFEVKKSGGISGVGSKTIVSVYRDPTGLVWNGQKYVVQGNFQHTEKKEFDVTGRALDTFVALDQFEDALVQYLYGRSFSALPQEMREGDRKAALWLPQEGSIWPVSRRSVSWFDVDFSIYGASLGVRNAEKLYGI